jgi:hypothetical protein
MTNLCLDFTVFEAVCNYFASKISYKVSDDAPYTFEGVKEYYQQNNHLLIWNGASDDTIFSKPESNHAFRAWHDFCHIKANADFTPQGERQAMLMQIRMAMDCDFLSKRAKDICTKMLQIEVLGQLAYSQKYGDFPENQKLFTGNTYRGIQS